MIPEEKYPIVSVVVITYNQDRYIGECLQSILDQKTDFPFEVIVGDDCSTDRTREIILGFSEKYPEQVRPIFQDKNIRGGVNNYLVVHNAARGIYVAHVDGDDYLLPNKLQIQKKFLDENGEFSVVWHRANILNTLTGKLSQTSNLEGPYPSGLIGLGGLMRYGIAGVHSSLMYKRSARITRSTDIDVLDLFYSLEFLESGIGMILDDVLCTYRVLGESINSSNKNRVKKIAAHHIGYFYKKYPEYRKDVFLFASSNFIIDLFIKRFYSGYFLTLAIRSFCFITPHELFLHIKNLRGFR